MGKDMGCLTGSFAGKDFIDGNMDKSVFSGLTNNVFTRWDANYPLSEFSPCTKFQDKEVDPVENHHIPQDKFNTVPLIQDLVHQFQEIFCHLTITHVWLLRKSKLGDGFQGWHQDKLIGITNTIVVNLGDSNEISNKVHKETGQQKTLIMDYNNIQQSEGVNISCNKEGIVRKEAMEKKNCKQDKYAIKAMKMCGKAAVDSGIEIGALVSLKVDYRTHCHVQGLLAIVY
jgi:hypothetical protein